MAEDTWMKNERIFFVDENHKKFGLDKKKLNKFIESYNIFLQKATVGESPYVAEDLRLTILKSMGDTSATESEDRKS
jgi:hypothetical protein